MLAACVFSINSQHADKMASKFCVATSIAGLACVLVWHRKHLAHLLNCFRCKCRFASIPRSRAIPLISIKNGDIHESVSFLPNTDILINHLKSLAIPFSIGQYCAPVARQAENSEGIFAKNILLKDRKGIYYFLLCLEDRQLNLKKLKVLLNAHRNFSFASSEEVTQVLQVAPGALSPFCLMFDSSQPNPIKLVVDKRFSHATGVLNFHPFDDKLTLRITWSNLVSFLNCCNVKIWCVTDLPYT